MTKEHEASRTLVKSPPELWAECSDPESLGRHLGEFGEITITRLAPENAVAWEGEHASGTVRIEPSAWGTRVTLTAQTGADAPEPEPEAAAAPEMSEEAEETQPSAEAIPAIEPEMAAEEEERDATVEAALADPDQEPVADTGRARARWRRLTASMRGMFRPVDRLEEPEAPEELAAEAPAAARPEVQPDPEPAPPEPREPELLVEHELPEPGSDPEPEPEPEPSLDAEAILASALDSLGQAHHRPFSRA